MQAVGKLHTLWIAFAKFYERHGDIENARVIFDKATQVQCLPFKHARAKCAVSGAMPNDPASRNELFISRYGSTAQHACEVLAARLSLLQYLTLNCLMQVAFKYVEDLATVWCEWCEMELRHKNFKRALELMRRATYTPDKINRKEVWPLSILDQHVCSAWTTAIPQPNPGVPQAVCVQTQKMQASMQ